MAHAPKSIAMRYITRMDYARTTGWWVRFYAGATLLESRLFSDRKHGGTKVALAAAKVWRDENEGKWVTRRPGRPMYTERNRRNVTSVVGVALRINPRRKGLARFSWAALWSDGGRQRTRSFGVASHGYRRGFQLALDLRCDMLGLPRREKHPPPLHHLLANRAC